MLDLDPELELWCTSSSTLFWAAVYAFSCRSGVFTGCIQLARAANGTEEAAAWDDDGADAGWAVIGYIYVLHAVSDGFYAAGAAECFYAMAPEEHRFRAKQARWHPHTDPWHPSARATPRSDLPDSSPTPPTLHFWASSVTPQLSDAALREKVARRTNYIMPAINGAAEIDGLPDAYAFTREAARAAGLRVVRTYRLLNPAGGGG